MSQIKKGETFTDVLPGRLLDPTRLNNHVDGAILLNGAVLDQTEKTVPVAADTLLLGDSTVAASGAPKKVQVGNLLVEFQRNGTQQYQATDTGAANAYAVALSPAATTYAAGMVVRFKAGAANTGASTINVNGLGTKTIKTRTGADLVANDIVAGQVVELVYEANSGYFQLQNPILPRAGEVTAAMATENLRGSINQYATGGGTANAHTVTLTPAPTAYTAGLTVRFKAIAANTGAATLNVNSLGAIAMKRNGLDLAANDILAGQLVQAVYDGTNFQISVSGTGNGFVSAATNLATTSVPGANARILNVTHNLGAIPTRLRVVLVCATAEQGYSVGDEIDIAVGVSSGKFTVAVNATNVIVVQTNTSIAIGSNTGTLGTAVNITLANWQLKVYANL